MSAAEDEGAAAWDGDEGEPVPLALTRARRDLKLGDEAELADRLSMLVDADRRGLVFAEGMLHRYTPRLGLWAPVPEAECVTAVSSLSGATIGEGKKARPLRVSHRTCIGAMRILCARLADEKFFAKPAAVVGFADGAVEVTADGSSLRAHSPDHRLRHAYPFGWAPGAECPLWDKFCSEAFDGDDGPQKAALVHEFVGLSLLGLAPRFQRCIVLHGEGRNGKSVVTEVVEAAAPPGSLCAVPPQTWDDEYRVDLLSNRLLNVVSELPESELMESASFKAIVTGEPTTARRIMCAPYTMNPRAGHLFAANRLPDTSDQTLGFWRRFAVVQMQRVVPESEVVEGLAASIVAAELPGIVARFLDGAERALARGYSKPASCADAITEWQRNANPVKRFVEDCTEPSPEGWHGDRAEDLYASYKAWTVKWGHRCMSLPKFAMRVQMLLGKPHHSNSGNRYPVSLKLQGVE